MLTPLSEQELHQLAMNIVGKEMEELPRHLLEDWQSDKGFKVIYNHYAPYVWRLAFRTVYGTHLVAQ